MNPEVQREFPSTAPEGVALLALGALLGRIRETRTREAHGRPVDVPADTLLAELDRVEAGLGPVWARLSQNGPALQVMDPAHRVRAMRLMAALVHQRLVEGDHHVLLGELVTLAASGQTATPEWIAAFRLAGELCRAGVFRADEGSLATTEVELGRPLAEFVLGADTPWEPDPVGIHWRLRRADVDPGPPARDPTPAARPAAICAQLAGRVIGLDTIVRPFACRLSRHLAKRGLHERGGGADVPNECLLFIGPSGSGKTWLAESAGRLLGLPFASSSATDMTAEGYSGLSVDEALRPLTDGRKDPGPGGICFVDEWDKKAATGTEKERDVGGRVVQQGMLRLMEGTTVRVGGRRGGGNEGRLFDTRGTLFVFAGAFEGLAPLLSRRQGRCAGMGFGGSAAAPEEDALHTALLEYGMIPEFLNRLTGIFVFPELTACQLHAILTAPGSGIVAAQNLVLQAFDLQLQLDPAASALLVARALRGKSYSRGLRRMVDRIADRIMMDGRSGSFTTTPDVVMDLFESDPALGDAA